MSSDVCESDKKNKKKFIVFKAAGGLTHMMVRLSRMIDLSKKLKRHLIIDCVRHSAFLHRFDEYFTINDKELSYSCDYKVIPSNYKYYNHSIDFLEKNCASYKDGKYYLKNHLLELTDDNMNDDVIALHYYHKSSCYVNPNIKVKENIMKRIKQNKKINKKYISIHFRNTDKSNDFSEMISKIKKVKQTSKINTLYVATDDFSFFDKLKVEFPNTKLIRYTIPENHNGKNIHYRTRDKDKIIINCLIDMYMIIHSTYFIPSINSGLSRWITHIINNNNNNNNLFNIKTPKIIIYK